MVYDKKALTKLWITYLKNNQIVSTKSDPQTGKLNYKRNPTADDVAQFLKLKTNFDDQVISTAIRDALENKPPSKSGNKIPSKSGLSTASDKSTPPKETTAATRDAETTDSSEPKGLSQTPGAIRKREQRAAASQASKAGAAAFGQIASQLTKNNEFSTDDESEQDSTEKRPKLHTKPKTPGTATTKPRLQYRGLREDIADIAGEEVDEPTVEQIFNSLAFHASDEEEPEPEVSPEEQRNIELKKIKRLVRDSMSDQQIRSLWRALKDNSAIAESFIGKGDVNAIFKKAAEIRVNPPGLGRMFKSLRKDTIDVNDLQQAWKDAGFPDDTQDIMYILKNQGYGDKEIKKVFSSVFGDSDEDEGYADPETSPAVLKIADYIKKKNMTNDMVQFLERDYGELLGTAPKQGMLSRIKKKFTTEDIRQIFTQIVKEERSNRINLIRAHEHTNFGRNKK